MKDDSAAFLTGLGLATVLIVGPGMYSEHRLRQDQSAQNHHCARSGGRLLRGQAKEFVCIDPRGVKWTVAK